ncbi:G2/mitotic-specific cyclin S13-6-like, partial [Cannabis sativa]|uniref:G2/mitotic-specific cyclin S13-6-like n=1 Tax=Cannabis sativa TaxID=3483 RepID=UPI0029CA6B69
NPVIGIGEAVIGGGENKLHKKNPVAHDGKNRRALGYIGNMVPAARGGVEGKPNRPMTRVFMRNYLLTMKSLELLRRTSMLFSNYAMQKQMVVPDDGRRIEALEANKINKIVNVKPKPIEVINLSSNTEKVKKKPEKPLNNMEKEVEVGGGALRKKAPTLTSVLIARSKVYLSFPFFSQLFGRIR